MLLIITRRLENRQKGNMREGRRGSNQTGHVQIMNRETKNNYTDSDV